MRYDDKEEKAYFRSTERLFRVNSDWYFSAREGDQGPFASEQMAAGELSRFIEEQVGLQKIMKSGVKVVVMDKGQTAQPLSAQSTRETDESAQTFEKLGMVI